MTALRTTAVAVVIVSFLAPSLAMAGSARSRAPLHAKKAARSASGQDHMRRGVRHAVPFDADPPGAYPPEGWEGATLRRQALINQYAPGVTNELAPENKATATGGPSGGIPGFSGR